MLYVRVHYGLGNQLFQYSLGRSLSLQKGVAFRLDKQFFVTDVYTEHPRVYQLDQFNILENIAPPAEVAVYTQPSFLRRRFRAATGRLLPYYRKSVVNEIRLDFDENIFKIKEDAYLFGFWQDARYFLTAEKELRRELTFKNPARGLNLDLLHRIGSGNAVNLHIRRGDYLTDSYTVDNVGICDLPYYYEAVRRITAEVPDAVFYVFSDDPEWVRTHFHIDLPTVYVTHNSQEMAFEDLRLMSACKHHIIANSSFSWWAAWLADHQDKKVIAPRIWRSKGPQMFLPQGWRIL